MLPAGWVKPRDSPARGRDRDGPRVPTTPPNPCHTTRTSFVLGGLSLSTHRTPSILLCWARPRNGCDLAAGSSASNGSTVRTVAPRIVRHRKHSMARSKLSVIKKPPRHARTHRRKSGKDGWVMNLPNTVTQRMFRPSKKKWLEQTARAGRPTRQRTAGGGWRKRELGRRGAPLRE